MAPEEGTARLAAILATHPEIEVHLTTVADLDEDDVAMVEAVITHLVAKRAKEA